MDTMLQRIFKAYDMRGLVNKELTPELYKKIGQSFANWLSTEGAVAVGHDMRPSSRGYADAVIEGLVSQGRDVLDVGMVTSEMIPFVVGEHQLAGGVVITASHNPAQYNGAKFCREEAKPMGLDSGLSEVRDGLAADYDEAATPGNVTKLDVTEEWIDHVMSFIDTSKLREMRIAVDAGNGMAGYIFAEAEPYLPFEVTELYFEPDGTFPNHEANPMKFETLTDLIAVIKRDGLDGGIAFDGDGDRVFLVDETGTVLSGGVTSALLADYFMQQEPGANIVYDVRNSKVVRDVVEAAGGTAYRARVGHSLIKIAMREHDALFGGEASGHFFFRDNYYADSGLIASLVALYAVSLSGKKLSDVRKQYSTYAAIEEMNFVVEDTAVAIEAVAAAFADAEQDRLDGISLAFEDAWLNIRPSNTEPILRLNAEATSQQRLDSLVQKIHDLVSA